MPVAMREEWTDLTLLVLLGPGCARVDLVSNRSFTGALNYVGSLDANVSLRHSKARLQLRNGQDTNAYRPKTTGLPKSMAAAAPRLVGFLDHFQTIGDHLARAIPGARRLRLDRSRGHNSTLSSSPGNPPAPGVSRPCSSRTTRNAIAGG